MSFAVLAAFALTGASSVVSGVVMVALSRMRASGSFLALAGILDIGAVLMQEAERRASAETAFMLAIEVAVVALVMFPSVRHEHAVDFLVLALVLAAIPATLVLALSSTDPTVSETVAGITIGVFVLHVWWRLERSREAERRALWWMSLATGAALLVVVFAIFSDIAGSNEVGAVGSAFALAWIGPSVAVGAVRPEILEVRTLVVRVVVLATAVVGYVTLFLTVTSFLNALGQPAPAAGTLAVVGVLCALAFHPFEVVLRGVVDQLLFGERPDPLGAASQVIGSLSDGPEAALEVIREALIVPFARLVIDGELVAVSGDGSTAAQEVELPLGGARVGRLEVGLRPGDLTLTDNDTWLLRIVAPLLAQTLHMRALAEEVQSSRERTVAALEEERRRLRRDLHDGLGPRLAGIAFTSQAARNTLRSDPVHADNLIGSLREEAAAAIGEIRQLVYDMRPPALDELGLAGALDQRLPGIRSEQDRPFRVSLSADDTSGLAAAVEVAAYRIVMEAVTNAARHGSAEDVRVVLTRAEDALTVEVTDDGSSHAPWVPGVGLTSMRERAEELGGSLTVTHGVDGAQVKARLPLWSTTDVGGHRSARH